MEETALHRFFSSAEERFGRCDAIIAKQSEQIQQLSDQFSQLKKSIDNHDQQHELEKKLTEMNAEVVWIRKHFSKASKLWGSLENQFQKVKQQIDSDLTSLRLNVDQQLEIGVKAAQEQARLFIQQEIVELRGLIYSHREESGILHQNVIEKVCINSEQISELKVREDELNVALSSLSSEMKSMSANLREKSEVQFQLLKSEITTLSIDRPLFPIRPPICDLDSLKLRSEPFLDPDSPPRLPEIVKFEKIPEAIDYLYELIPTLQAILTSSHRRINEKFTAIVKRDLVIPVLQSELSRLTAMIPTLATREELITAIRKRGLPRESRGLGIVKCISCGKELIEEDPPDHQWCSSPRISLKMVEEPRGTRCPQRAQIRRKIQRP
jgi:uncharacterized membrane-anchored protein YhcB (DUF1043 family)